MKFLVIDDNPENRFLLSKTLLRKYPKAAIVECQAVDTAVELVRTDNFRLVVAHRTPEANCVALVRAIRDVNADVPLIAVSGIDRRKASMTAGASAFQLFDEWLMLGKVAAQLLARGDDDRVSSSVDQN